MTMYNPLDNREKSWKFFDGYRDADGQCHFPNEKLTLGHITPMNPWTLKKVPTKLIKLGGK